MLRNLLAILLLLILLAGCGAPVSDSPVQQGSMGNGQAETPISSTPAATAQTATSERAPGGVHTNGHEAVITFRRSGGIAGMNDVMMIHPDETVALDRDGKSSTSTVEPAALAALQQTLAGAEWQALDPEYGEQFPDAFAYTIEGGGKTVRTYDGAENPEILTAVLGQLNDLFVKASG